MLRLHVYVAVVLLAQNGYSLKQGDSCILKHTNTPGFCVPAHKCHTARQNYETHGVTPTFCSTSIENIIICCSDENATPNKAINNPESSNNQQTMSDKLRLSEKKCAEYSSRLYENVTYISLLPGSENVLVSIPKCNYNGVELIVREDVEQGEFPHMVAIGWDNFDGTYSLLCGGSLISTKFVLTAAHCTTRRDSNPVIVRLGGLNLDQTKNDKTNPIQVPIKNIRKHPQYKAPGKNHDIALLELVSEVDFNDAVSPACLWNRPDFSGYTIAVATGWRYVDLKTQRPTNDMKKVSIRLNENDHCNVWFKTERSSLWADGLIEKQLCGEVLAREDTCQLIAGSPLQVASRGNNCLFHLIGVTSYGNKCSQSGSPAVYTRVSSYLDWIESVVWPGES